MACIHMFSTTRRALRSVCAIILVVIKQLRHASGGGDAYWLATFCCFLVSFSSKFPWKKVDILYKLDQMVLVELQTIWFNHQSLRAEDHLEGPQVRLRGPRFPLCEALLSLDRQPHYNSPLLAIKGQT